MLQDMIIPVQSSGESSSIAPNYLKYADGPVTYDMISGADYPLLELNGYTVYVRYDTSDSTFKLLTIKEDGTESISAISNASSDQAYLDAFKIIKVSRLDSDRCYIALSRRYTATAVYEYNQYTVSVYSDGTLYKMPNSNAGLSISSAITTSSTACTQAFVIQGLFDPNCIIYGRYLETLSSGAHSIYISTAYQPYSGGTLSGVTTIANTDPHIRNYMPDLSIVNSRGGLFYTIGGTTDVNRLVISYYPNDAYKTNTLANHDLSGKLASLGVINHYMIGTTVNNIVVTTQIDMLSDPTKYIYHFYLWRFFRYTGASTAATITNDLRPIDMVEGEDIIETPAGTRLLSFIDDVIAFSDGTRYQLFASDGIIASLPSARQVIHDIYSSVGDVGPGSDPYNGVYVYN